MGIHKHGGAFEQMQPLLFNLQGIAHNSAIKSGLFRLHAVANTTADQGYLDSNTLCTQPRTSYETITSDPNHKN